MGRQLRTVYFKIFELLSLFQLHIVFRSGAEKSSNNSSNQKDNMKQFPF